MLSKIKYFYCNNTIKRVFFNNIYIKSNKSFILNQNFTFNTISNFDNFDDNNIVINENILKWTTKINLNPFRSVTLGRVGQKEIKPELDDEKVTVEVNLNDLDDLLNDDDRKRLEIIADQRYNPNKQTLKLTSRRYKTRVENRRFLLIQLKELIREAKIDRPIYVSVDEINENKKMDEK